MMFELAGTHHSKGVFELRLERLEKGPRKYLSKIGPIYGRLSAMVLFLIAVFLNFKRQPSTWLLLNGYVDTLDAASRIQQTLVTGLMGVGIGIYLLVFFVHREGLLLIFDKSDKTLRYHKFSTSRFKRGEEGLISFSEITEFKVFGPQENPPTPYGHILFKAKKLGVEHEFRVALLSEEQFKFYPLNFSKIMDRDPVSKTWKDPNEEVPA